MFVCFFGMIYGYIVCALYSPKDNNTKFLFSVSDSGYKRTWQQVKVKHKNIVQTGTSFASWLSQFLGFQICSSYFRCLPLQLREGGPRWWGRTGGRPPRRWSLPRTTCSSTETDGSGWTSCPAPPAWSPWPDPTPLSSAVHHVALYDWSPLKVIVPDLTPSAPRSSSVSGHPVLLLPVTKKEPESLSSDDTDVSDSHMEGVSVLQHVIFLSPTLSN